jgi:hypothetical protein
VELFIQFIIKYNEKIIFTSIGVICFLSAMAVWFQIFGKKNNAATNVTQSLDLSGIEESLRKILSQTHSAIDRVSNDQEKSTEAVNKTTTESKSVDYKPGTKPMPSFESLKDAGIFTMNNKQPLTDMDEVKQELVIRAEMIEALQKQVANSNSGGAPQDLLDKLKTLENKLSEYEIIEDDIADLTRLKEENQTLKIEIESLKSDGATTVRGAKLVDEFAQVVSGLEAKPEDKIVVKGTPEDIELDQQAPISKAAEKTAVAAPTATPEAVSQPEAVLPPQDDAQAMADAQLAEAQAAIALEKELSKKPAPAPVNITPKENITADAKSDIFGEFASGDGGANAEADPLLALGEIDADRMLDELKDLNAEMGAGLETLMDSTNVDKMADEAAGMNKKI